MGDSNMALTGGTNELGVYEPDLQLLQNRLRPRVSVVGMGVEVSLGLDVVFS